MRRYEMQSYSPEITFSVANLANLEDRKAQNSVNLMFVEAPKEWRQHGNDRAWSSRNPQ